MWIQTPMLIVHLKSFGCKRLNLTESFWHGPCTSLLFPLWLLFFIFWFFCFSFLSLGVALHYILGVFYSIYIYKIKIKRGNKEKEAHCVFALFSLFLKTVFVNLFSHDMSLVLCLAHLTSWSFVVHVVWERCLWCLSLCFNLEVTCCLTVELDPFEKGINNHLTTVH